MRRYSSLLPGVGRGGVVTNPCFDASTNGMVGRYPSHSPLPTPRGGVARGGGWRNEGTIESKRELVVAVEAGKYNNGKKRFESAR